MSINSTKQINYLPVSRDLLHKIHDYSAKNYSSLHRSFSLIESLKIKNLGNYSISKLFITTVLVLCTITYTVPILLGQNFFFFVLNYVKLFFVRILKQTTLKNHLMLIILSRDRINMLGLW